MLTASGMQAMCKTMHKALHACRCMRKQSTGDSQASSACCGTGGRCGGSLTRVQEGNSICAPYGCGATGTYFLIQLAQFLGQVPALSVAAVDVADPFPLSVAQAKQLLSLLELLCLQACQLF